MTEASSRSRSWNQTPTVNLSIVSIITVARRTLAAEGIAPKGKKSFGFLRVVSTVEVPLFSAKFVVVAGNKLCFVGRMNGMERWVMETDTSLSDIVVMVIEITRMQLAAGRSVFDEMLLACAGVVDL